MAWFVYIPRYENAVKHLAEPDNEESSASPKHVVEGSKKKKQDLLPKM
jgi:hypothetical protein